MEKVMSKTTLKTPQGRDGLRDSELDVVTGGGGGLLNVDVQGAPIAVSPTVGIGVGGGGGGGYIGSGFNIHFKN
jgi:hypothetical protein